MNLNCSKQFVTEVIGLKTMMWCVGIIIIQCQNKLATKSAKTN